MSGPFVLDLNGDVLGLLAVNDLPLNGNAGSLALYIQPVADSAVLVQYIGGVLNMKEKNCGWQNGSTRRPRRSGRLVGVCDKVAP